MLHTLSLEAVGVRPGMDGAAVMPSSLLRRRWVWYVRSQGPFGDEWSKGPDTGVEQWLMGPMRARVSLASVGLQLSRVAAAAGSWSSRVATEPSLWRGESTVTASGSSWGSDCLLRPSRGMAGKQKRKNRPFPDGAEQREPDYRRLFSTEPRAHGNTRPRQWATRAARQVHGRFLMSRRDLADFDIPADISSSGNSFNYSRRTFSEVLKCVEESVPSDWRLLGRCGRTR